MTDTVQHLRHLIEQFLAGRVDGTEVRVEGLRLAGGGSSRENWPFELHWTGPDGRRHVDALLLRRDPASTVVDTGRRAEFELLAVLGPTDVPAPGVRHLDDVGTELGRPAMVVDRHEGRADRAVLRSTDPLQLGVQGRTALARAMCRELVRVHAVDVSTLPDSLPRPDETGPATSELARWEATLADVQLEPQPELALVRHWLHRHLPAPAEELVLVHGDFRPANVLVADGDLEVLLDWELAHIGDPLDDLGWYLAPVYRREHLVPGAWEVDDVIRTYELASGRAVDRAALAFWQGMAQFRLAVIALTRARHFCEGTTDRPAGATRDLVRRLARGVLQMTAGDVQAGAR